MAKRIPNSCDNKTQMEQEKFRIDEITGEKFVAVTDPSVLEKLCEIKDNLTDEFCTKLASETLSALNVVRLDNPTEISKATNDTDCPDATVFGVTRTSGVTGSNVEVVDQGKFYDSSFNFPVNAPLFLGVNGVITDVPPTSGFLTQIGYSGGPGLIIIDINDPIML